MNICGMKHVAGADAALVEVFINSPIVNNTLIMICTVETLSMRRINASFQGCRIKFTQVYFRLNVDMVFVFFALYYITSLMCV